MRIFLSWSGVRSKHVALALREWLPLVLHYAEPWLSEKDIQAGDRWATEVGKELESSAFGVLVLTRENLSAPWMLFEAGALSKAFSAAAVCPFLVGVDFSDLTGPLSQFQAKKAHRDGMLELIEAINARAPSPVPPDRLRDLMTALWPRLESSFARLPSGDVASGTKPRSQAQVLEDLVSSVRRLEMRIDQLPKRVDRSPNRGRAAEHTVELEVKGRFPDLEEGVTRIEFTPTDDLIEEVAAIAGLDDLDYGSDWYLRDDTKDHILERKDGVVYLAMSRGGRLRLVLTRVPF